MTTKTNQPQQERKEDFGLPQVEFKPIEAGGRRWLKITAIIVGIVLLIGAGFTYWFFYHAPAHDFSMEAQTIPERQGSGVPRTDVDAMDDDTPARRSVIEQDAKTPKLAKEPKTLASEEGTKGFSRSHTTKPKRGTITRINTPRSCYYIVVGSFIDEDLASDYANRLAQQGVNVMLIAPPQGRYYSRIAIGHADTFRGAHKKAEVLKATYGADTWVMKY